MRSGWLRLLAALGMVLVTAGTAEADILIPCTGEHLVKVLDIPWPADTPPPRIDLGYKFNGCFGGEWVGYAGNDTKYLHVSDEQIALMLSVAKLDRLPSPPSRFAHPETLKVPAMWGGALLVAGVVLSLLARRRRGRGHTNGILADLEADLAANEQSSGDAAPPSSPPARSKSSHPHATARASFGLRGNG